MYLSLKKSEIPKHLLKYFTNKKPQWKAGDLVNVPHQVALALQADGWILRQDIVWHKPSPMPESVQSRCTKSHEYVFLFAKSNKYFCDMEAIKEKSNTADLPPRTLGNKQAITECDGMVSHNEDHAQAVLGRVENRNKRSVWTVDSQEVLAWMAENTPEAFEEYLRQSENKTDVWRVSSQGYPGAHFATFSPKLIEPMILAGTSEKGCCAKCGAPWRRLTEKTALKRERPNEYVKRTGEAGTGNSCANTVAGVVVDTLGWEPGCTCEADVVPCTVLDPFIGSGTTAVVSLDHGRRCVGIDLSTRYLEENCIPRVKAWCNARPGKRDWIEQPKCTLQVRGRSIRKS